MFDPRKLDPNAPAEPPVPSAPIEPRMLLDALRAHRRWLIVGTIGGALLGAVGAKTCLAHRYKASATLVRDSTLQGSALEVVRTQRAVSDLIKMPSSAAEVRKRLALPLTIDELEKRVEVAAASDSSVVTVHASSESPEAATQLTDAFVAVFLEMRQSVERQRLAAMLDAATDDMRAAQGSLEKAHSDYALFRAEHDLIDLDAEQKFALERDVRLRLEAELADADAQGEQARQKSLSTSRARLPSLTLLSQRQTSPAAEKLSDTLVELVSARSRLSADHPVVMALQARSTSLREELGQSPLSAPVERTLGTNPARESIQTGLFLAAAQEAAQHRKHDTLASLSKSSHDQVTQLAQLEGQNAELSTRLKSAEAHLVELQGRRTSLEDGMRSPSAGFQVAARALSPDASPSLLSTGRVVFALSTLLSALLVTMIVLLRSIAGARRLPAPRPTTTTGYAS